jgi:hypothetical protein
MFSFAFLADPVHVELTQPTHDGEFRSSISRLSLLDEVAARF